MDEDKLNKLTKFITENVGKTFTFSEMKLKDLDVFKEYLKYYIDSTIHLPERIDVEFSSDYLKFRIKYFKLRKM